ncbi:MAG: acyl-CoA dehydrogenase family protein [Salinarimonas sp.]|nr:acyl-CoA dehydrogenase family protein [Salinarimonas sp.]
MNAEQFRQRLEAFVEAQIRDQVAEWEAGGRYPATLHREAGEAGILSVGMSSDDAPCAPLDAGLMRRAMLIRGLARGGAQSIAVGLGSHFVPLSAVAGGSKECANEIAPSIWNGTHMIALALTEPHGGSNLRDIRSYAQRDGSNYRISGEKAFICNGTRAEYLLVSACLADSGPSLFLVESGERVRKQPLVPLGWRALPQAHLTFVDAPARLVGQPGSALRLLRPALALERVNLAVLAITSARLLFDEMLADACMREIDGCALAEKQAPAHRLACSATQLRIVETFVDALLTSFGEDGAPAMPPQTDIAMAKNAATRLLELVAREAVQFAGARGCVAPSLAERMFRDARLLAIGGGSEEVMNEIIVRDLRRNHAESNR